MEPCIHKTFLWARSSGLHRLRRSRSRVTWSRFAGWVHVSRLVGRRGSLRPQCIVMGQEQWPSNGVLVCSVAAGGVGWGGGVTPCLGGGGVKHAVTPCLTGGGGWGGVAAPGWQVWNSWDWSRFEGARSPAAKVRAPGNRVCRKLRESSV